MLKKELNFPPYIFTAPQKDVELMEDTTRHGLLSHSLIMCQFKTFVSTLKKQQTSKI